MRRTIPIAIVGTAILAAAYGQARSRNHSSPTALQVLSSHLDDHAAVAQDSDSSIVVTKVEWQAKPASDAERRSEAAATAAMVRRHWHDPRLRQVSVVFERQTRLGPFVVGLHKYVVNVPLSRPLPDDESRPDGVE